MQLTIINLIMGVWYIAYNLELTKKCYLLKKCYL